VIAAAIQQLPGTLVARSPIVGSRPVGPSQRDYANAAVLIEAELGPAEMLFALKAIEGMFGRRRAGQRWAARVLDLDILLWSGGIWASPTLTIPHRQMAGRRFVLGPLAEIAAGWRDPLTGLSIAQLRARLDRPRAHD
jgi:2-amino-4-hydroxy-6-hydroxymethyldihydropteridine diphosphokinase